MTKRISITVSNELYTTMQQHKHSMNVSKVCAGAIVNEVMRLIEIENKLKPKVDSLLKDYSKDEIINVLKS